MAYNDLQVYLTRLEAAGKLHWIEQRVDPSWEVSAITRHTFDRYGWNDRPALGFRQVGVSEFPLVIGVIGGSPEIYALALSTTVDKIPEVWERGQRHPIDPVIVPTGLCKEIIIRSSAIDLGSLPQVVWTPNQDPGPYITAPVVITKDAETGRRNVGTYRLQLKGANRLGLYVGGAQHAARHIRQYEALKKDMPIAIAIGMDPTVVLTSISKFPYGTDEFSIAGGLRGEPVPLVRCETVDLQVPANAEIVLEGVLRAGYREQEGPFGEFSGYMSTGGPTAGDRRHLHHPKTHAGVSFFFKPNAAQRIELHPQLEPFRWIVSPPAQRARSAGAGRPLHRSRRRQRHAGDLDEKGISRAGQRSRLGRLVADEQGRQIYRRGRRRHRRAQSIPSRMGHGFSRPTGAR